MTTRRPARRLLISSITVALAAGTVLAAPAQATSSGLPSLRLTAGTDTATITLHRRGDYEVHFPVYAASTGGAFELWAQRPSFDQPVGLSQVERDAAGSVNQIVPLPGAPEPTMGSGLPQFFTTVLARRNGTVLKEVTRAFCPNGWNSERIDDTGPVVPRYPVGCWASPFTSGAVWGVDQGWASITSPSLGHHLRVDPGNYRLTVSITDTYRTLFDIAPEDASVSVPVTVSKSSTSVVEQSPRQKSGVARPESLPITEPPADALPNIVALPAWGMGVSYHPRSGRSFLVFGATAWNEGKGPLVVEGFRDPANPTMDAFQYFYDGDTVVGKVPAGQLEYDSRKGHDHWHFQDFAQYSLLDSGQNLIVDSGKEAFCLAPTDPIDLTVDGAEWRPWVTDLSTACGEQGSLWIREALEVGWGDTYTQYRPGQSFDITDLPNGTYYVRVTANPDGVLRETTDADNVALREISLHGKPGRRWVEVPPVGLIDTEHVGCGQFC